MGWGCRSAAHGRRARGAGRIAAALAASVVASACGEPVKRPNILLAISDDQSWEHVSAAGTRGLETPAFDRVAASGVRFEHAFANAPGCAPSRAAILTGRPIWALGEAACQAARFPRTWPTFTEILDREGYLVGYTGKGWGPGSFGTDPEDNPVGWAWNARQPSAPPSGTAKVDYAGNFADFLAARRSGQPFFFWYGGFEPHRPYASGLGQSRGKRPDEVRVPAFLPDTPAVRSDLLDYYAEIEWFDEQLSRMLALLEQAGELEQTLVVVTSDNGMPFPRAKANLYDHGTRVPLAIAWPERIAGGRVVTDFATLAELASTLLEASGIRPPASMLEPSLLPLLLSGASGRVIPERDHVVLARERHTWCNPAPSIAPMRAIRTDRWLYVRNLRPEVWPAGHPNGRFSHDLLPFGDVEGSPTKWLLLEERSSHPREFQLAFGRRSPDELYDVGADPAQIENLAGEPRRAQVLGELRERLAATLAATADPRASGGGAVFDDAPYIQSRGVDTGGLYAAEFEALGPDKQRVQRERARARALSLSGLRARDLPAQRPEAIPQP